MRYNSALDSLLLIYHVRGFLSGSCEGVGRLSSCYLGRNRMPSIGVIGSRGHVTGGKKTHFFGEVFGGPEPDVDRDTQPEWQLPSLSQ